MTRRDLCLAAAGAVLVSLSYPPFHLCIPSFVCLVPAVLLIEEGNSDRLPLRRQLEQGLWFGAMVYGLSLYWMVFALWRYTPLSVLGYTGAVLLLSAYSAVFFAICGWIRRATSLPIVVVFPLLWTSQEWVLAHQGDLRFPWLGLGTSLTGFPTLVQVADLVGARGITYLLALANATLAVAWLKRSERRRAILLMTAVVCGVAGAGSYGFVRERLLKTRSLGEVTLLQPNVTFADKWNAGLQDSIVRSLVEMSVLVHNQSDPDLVVWPEGAIPGDVFRRPDWRSWISTFADETGTPLVVGGLHYQSRADSTTVRFNSAFLFDSLGRIDTHPVYHKQFLVPVTERVPFLPDYELNLPWLGSFEAGMGGIVYEIGMGSFGILICYESAFEQLSREYRLKGAEFLVNITNDSWFGHTTAPHQHASHLVMRAIETRLGVVRAANSGITEFVDPLGHVQKRTVLGANTHLTGLVSTSDMITAYARFGDWVGGTSVLVAITLLAYSWWRGKEAV